jgi:hypothetical protein
MSSTKNYHINFDDISSKMLFVDAISTFNGIYNIKLERPKKHRSKEENKYFHGVVLPMIAMEIGDLETEVKEELKAMFLGYTETNKFGVVVSKVKPTSSLTTQEMEKFLDDCRHWAYHFLNLVIPLPNEIIE